MAHGRGGLDVRAPNHQHARRRHALVREQLAVLIRRVGVLLEEEVLRVVQLVLRADHAVVVEDKRRKVL